MTSTKRRYHHADYVRVYIGSRQAATQYRNTKESMSSSMSKGEVIENVVR
ncbi:MAG TPA: hypothetical protein VHP31_01235 [Caproicibacter sp.]|nr:hypothetical protein [Caproicibacter sp.]